MANNHFHIPENPKRLELEAIKRRQLSRKQAGEHAAVTIDMLYNMLFDVLENQARIMNYLERGKFND